jgi:hypothetical protein
MSVTSAIHNPVLTGNCAFRVVIVYEDYLAGESAMDTYRRLLSQFGRQFDFRVSIWRFGALATPNLIGASVHDAIQADAIIVATYAHDDLPASVRNWIDTWLPLKRGQTSILISLLKSIPGEPQASGEAEEYLRRAAASAGIEFLTREIPMVKEETLPRAVEIRPSYRLATEGWGLNE